VLSAAAAGFIGWTKGKSTGLANKDVAMTDVGEGQAPDTARTNTPLEG